MREIITPCAYCQKPITVGFWTYLPSRTAVEIYCPVCHGQNEINRASILIGLTAWLVVGSVGYALVPTSWASGNAAFPLLLLSTLIGAWPAAFISSRLPRLVKYTRWWIRSSPAISDLDRELMNDLGIEHNGHYFIVGDMHFDHLREALTYARSESSRAA
jgi:hypothetical protein